VAFYVYILASGKNGTLYVGSTENLTVRISEHKQGLTPGFTSRYGVKDLVWYELHDTRDGAFRRERRIKEWKRAWKVRLIEKRNLQWRDLYEEFLYGDLKLQLPTPSDHPTPTSAHPVSPTSAHPFSPTSAHPGEGRDPGQVTQVMQQGSEADPQWIIAEGSVPTCPGSRPSPG
jgi:putative endonuclease